MVTLIVPFCVCVPERVDGNVRKLGMANKMLSVRDRYIYIYMAPLNVAMFYSMYLNDPSSIWDMIWVKTTQLTFLDVCFDYVLRPKVLIEQ